MRYDINLNIHNEAHTEADFSDFVVKLDWNRSLQESLIRDVKFYDSNDNELNYWWSESEYPIPEVLNYSRKLRFWIRGDFDRLDTTVRMNVEVIEGFESTFDTVANSSSQVYSILSDRIQGAIAETKYSGVTDGQTDTYGYIDTVNPSNLAIASDDANEWLDDDNNPVSIGKPYTIQSPINYSLSDVQTYALAFRLQATTDRIILEYQNLNVFYDSSTGEIQFREGTTVLASQAVNLGTHVILVDGSAIEAEFWLNYQSLGSVSIDMVNGTTANLLPDGGDIQWYEWMAWDKRITTLANQEVFNYLIQKYDGKNYDVNGKSKPTIDSISRLSLGSRTRIVNINTQSDINNPQSTSDYPIIYNLPDLYRLGVNNLQFLDKNNNLVPHFWESVKTPTKWNADQIFTIRSSSIAPFNDLLKMSYEVLITPPTTSERNLNSDLPNTLPELNTLEQWLKAKNSNYTRGQFNFYSVNKWTERINYLENHLDYTNLFYYDSSLTKQFFVYALDTNYNYYIYPDTTIPMLTDGCKECYNQPAFTPRFNGSSQTAQIDLGQSYSSTTRFSLVLVMQPNGKDGQVTIEGDSASDIVLNVDTNQAVYTSNYMSTANYGDYLVTIMNYDGNDTWTLYGDGVQLTQDTIPTTSFSSFKLNTTSEAHVFEFMVFNDELSQADINKLQLWFNQQYIHQTQFLPKTTITSEVPTTSTIDPDKGKDFDLKVEIDFIDGNGWQDVTSRVQQVDVQQFLNSKNFLGLVSEECEVVIFDDDTFSKYLEVANFRVRVYTQVNSQSQQLLFVGGSSSRPKVKQNTVNFRAIDFLTLSTLDNNLTELFSRDSIFTFLQPYLEAATNNGLAVDINNLPIQGDLVDGWVYNSSDKKIREKRIKDITTGYFSILRLNNGAVEMKDIFNILSKFKTPEIQLDTSDLYQDSIKNLQNSQKYFFDLIKIFINNLWDTVDVDGYVAPASGYPHRPRPDSYHPNIDPSNILPDSLNFINYKEVDIGSKEIDNQKVLLHSLKHSIADFSIVERGFADDVPADQLLNLKYSSQYNNSNPSNYRHYTDVNYYLRERIETIIRIILSRSTNFADNSIEVDSWYLQSQSWLRSFVFLIQSIIPIQFKMLAEASIKPGSYFLITLEDGNTYNALVVNSNLTIDSKGKYEQDIDAIIFTSP